jgi:signal transduction histidine kinase/ligand-binding sensor domain-containing protein
MSLDKYTFRYPRDFRGAAGQIASIISRMPAAPRRCGIFQVERFALLLNLFLLYGTNLAAIDPHQPITQMHHTAWGAKEGVIGEVLAMAQTSDGFIWIGTTGGLLRFDGSEFDRYRPDEGSFPQPNWVSALLATPDGGLWIGNLSGGASFLKLGTIRNYGEAEGMPPGRVRAFAQESDGTVWAATAGGLAHFDGRRWKWAGKDGNLPNCPPGPPSSVAVNHQGVWVSYKEEGVFWLPKGARAFQQVSSRNIAGYLPTFTDASGEETWLWVPESMMLLRFPARVPDGGSPSRGTANSAGMFLIDRDGSGWMMTRGNGVWRIPVAKHLNRIISPEDPSIERFNEREGLTSATVYCAMEDREGDIWVGTLGGLDRFRPRNAAWTELQLVATQRMQLVAGDKGDVWASSPEGLWDARTGKRIHGGPTNIRASFRDPQGPIWFWSEQGNSGDLWRWADGRFEKAMSPSRENSNPAADKWVPAKGPVRALTRDGSGDLWVSIRGGGVFRLHDGAWNRIEVLKDALEMTAYGAIRDDEGRVWLAYPERRQIAFWDHGAIRIFSPETGLSIGAITQLAYIDGQVWAGGETGLAVYSKERFHSVEPAGGTAFGLVAGIAGSPGSGLWLSTASEIVHIPLDEVSRVIQDSSHKVQYETFDPVTDLAERPSATSDTPAVMGTDGILWVATPKGVIRVDPAHLHRNLVPPQVAIRNVAADGGSRSIYVPINLAPHTSNLHIGYSVLSFPIPERVRSRYRLLGYDKEWHDGGGRVDAAYDNLGPGHYTFQVMARNNDGVWNEAGTSQDFTIQPAFSQTVWFQLSYVLAAAIVVWFLYRLRLRYVAASIREHAEVRADERVRIARDLHDTLLQGIQGLTLHFHVAAQQLPEGNKTRESIERALVTADRVLVEGRDRVTRLRAQDLRHANISDAFEAVAADLNHEQRVRFSLNIEGRVEDILPSVLQELYYIGREAIANAFRHSKASEITVSLSCASKSIDLLVADNGCGFDSSAQETNPRAGHWGLPGMQERAEAVGAGFKCLSTMGKGTRVVVTVPARRGYRTRFSVDRT